jgi:hypothetical protein
MGSQTVIGEVVVVMDVMDVREMEDGVRVSE